MMHKALRQRKQIFSRATPIDIIMTDSITSKQKKEASKAIKTLKKLLGPGSEKPLESLGKLLSQMKIDESQQESSARDFSLPPSLKENFDYIGFSDGACRGNPGPGAWGALVQNTQEEVIFEASGVDVPTTNNKMELEGALRALEFMAQQPNHKAASVVLVSDSKYVVDGMNQWVPGWKKRNWRKADKKAPENVEIWQELDSLRDEFATLAFQWVKGHAGHPQNEYCDELANYALDEAGF